MNIFQILENLNSLREVEDIDEAVLEQNACGKVARVPRPGNRRRFLARGQVAEDGLSVHQSE